MVSCAVPPESGALPSDTLPSRNSTEPDGAAVEANGAGTTAASSVTGVPTGAGFDEDETATLATPCTTTAHSSSPVEPSSAAKNNVPLSAASGNADDPAPPG